MSSPQRCVVPQRRLIASSAPRLGRTGKWASFRAFGYSLTCGLRGGKGPPATLFPQGNPVTDEGNPVTDGTFLHVRVPEKFQYARNARGWSGRPALPPHPVTRTLQFVFPCIQMTCPPPPPGPRLPPCYPQARRKLWQHPNKTRRIVRTPRIPPAPAPLRARPPPASMP